LKNSNYLFAFIGIISVFIAGFSNIIEEKQNIEVQKRIGDENEYEF
jgi:hypothetical protein